MKRWIVYAEVNRKHINLFADQRSYKTKAIALRVIKKHQWNVTENLTVKEVTRRKCTTCGGKI